MPATSQPDRVGGTEKAAQMVELRLAVPRGALDVLGFRYYQLGIVKDDTALAQAAISEMVDHHLAQELAQLHNRRK